MMKALQTPRIGAVLETWVINEERWSQRRKKREGKSNKDKMRKKAK